MGRKPAVVIGIGNPYRCDDGIGPAAAAALDELRLPYAEVVTADGEPAALIEAWSGRELAMIIDAVRCEPSTPGRIWRSTDADLSGSAAAASSHALGIPDALRLGQALGRVPGRLVVFAVEAARLDLGAGLSPAVSAAVPRVVQAVLGELAALAAAARFARRRTSIISDPSPAPAVIFCAVRETAPGEQRVALVPESVLAPGRAKVHVLVEASAGDAACFPDSPCEKTGAEGVSREEAVGRVGIVASGGPAVGRPCELRPGDPPQA